MEKAKSTFPRMIRTSVATESPAEDKPSAERKPMPRGLEPKISEAEVKLVQRVFFGSVSPRKVVFCGVEHGNGSSRICGRAAEILAAQGSRVCVVDANIRTPSLHDFFHVTNSFGWTEALLDPETVLTRVQPVSKNLSVLAGGSRRLPINATMASTNLQVCLLELQAAFEFVLIDAPPAGVYADAGLLGQMTDGVVLVVEAHATRRQSALTAKKNLESANAKVLAAVLNKRTFPIPEGIFRRL